MIPLRTDSPLRNTPYMNWALIAANVLVFAYTGLHGMNTPGGHALDKFAVATRQPTVYQFFTYQFLHADWWHLAGNMLFLYIFGNNVNDKMGQLGYLMFYLAGGVAAALLYVATQGHEGQMIGASGAISAVTGAYLVLLPRSRITILWYFIFIGVTEVPSIYFIVGFFAYDVFLNFASSDQVAHGAHIGGTIFGFLMCVILLVFHLLPRDHFDIVALMQRWNRRRQYREVVNSGYNPFEYTQSTSPPSASRSAPPRPPDAQTQRILELRAMIAEAIGGRNIDLATQLFLDLKALDANQVLSKHNQLDVANHLNHQQQFIHAAEAYEAYIRQYPKSEQMEQVELMLGLLYSRYLANYPRAKDVLTSAVSKLHDHNQVSLAKEELAHIETLLTPKAPDATA